MNTPAMPHNSAADTVSDETKRLARLRMLTVLDTEPEPIFESLARLASSICNTPIALVTLLDGQRQWFKSNIGFSGALQTEQRIAFCAHTIQSSELMEVTDAQADARFTANPLVTGTPNIRFYAGVPLVMPGGERVGTLCVIDQRVRHLGLAQRLMLQELGQAVTQALLLRERAFYPEISGDEQRFKAIAEASPLGIFQADITGACIYTNPSWCDIYGLNAQQSAGHAWYSRIHPADAALVKHQLKKIPLTSQATALEYRLLHPDGRVAYIHAKVRPVSWGNPPQRGFVGSVEDITQRKQVESELRASNNFLDRSERISGVGGWELNLANKAVTWTQQMRCIYEVDASVEPNIKEHLKYFSVADMADMRRATQHAIDTGQPWELIAPAVTARGRPIWVRSTGLVEYENGLPVRLVGTLQDITAAKAAEQELKKANVLLRSVLDNLPCGVFVCDGELRPVAYNAYFQKLLDLPSDLLNAPGATFETFARYNAVRGCYGPGPVEELVAGVVEFARVPCSRHFERTLPTGITLDIRCAAMPGGGLITTYTDISVAKVADLALRRSQEQQHRALKASRLTLWDADLDTGMVYLSDSWSDLVGGSRGPVFVSIPQLLKYVPAQDLALVECALESILSGTTDIYAVEHRVRTASGALVWIHSEGRVIERDAAGHVFRATGTNRDITERKQAEQRLKLSAAMTRATLEATADGILVVNERREVVLFNQQFLDMLGVTSTLAAAIPHISSEALRHILLQQVTDPERFTLTTDAVYQSTQMQTQDVMEFKNGRVLERYSRVYLLDGRSSGWVWSFRDVTAKRAAERELQAAKLAAETANLAKTTFLATMSHEIRTPLNGILGISQLLLSEHLTAQQAQFASLIDASGQSLLVLVNDFLDVAKIESGLTVLDNSPFDLGSLLRETAALFAHRANAKRLAFGFTTAPDVPQWIYGDAPRLRQILGNLLGNALKFTAAGEFSLKVSCQHQADGCSSLRLCVADTGIGIAENIQGKLFAQFVQADSSTTRQYGGTGLGLAIVKLLCTLMGGSVELVSQTGKGSSFTVVLPNIKTAAPTQSTLVETVVPPDADGQTQTILLVEDNATNQIVAISLLKKIGYNRVMLAENGQQAIDCVLAGNFSAVLMDCQMPVMDGYAATRSLRARGCVVPIIAMTANAMTGDIAKCLDAGMSDYLAKPITQAALASKLLRWAGKGQQAVVAGSEAVETHTTDAWEDSPEWADQPTALVFDSASVMERLGDDQPLISDVIASFTQSTPGLIESLAGALAAKNAPLVSRHLHSLLGSSAAVSACSFNLLVCSLSQRLGVGDWAGVQQALPMLTHRLGVFARAAAAAGF